MQVSPKANICQASECVKCNANRDGGGIHGGLDLVQKPRGRTRFGAMCILLNVFWWHSLFRRT